MSPVSEEESGRLLLRRGPRDSPDRRLASPQSRVIQHRGRARGDARRCPGALRRAPRRSPAPRVVWPAGRARAHRVLAGPAQPFARPPRLRARRDGCDARASPPRSPLEPSMPVAALLVVSSAPPVSPAQETPRREAAERVTVRTWPRWSRCSTHGLPRRSSTGRSRATRAPARRTSASTASRSSSSGLAGAGRDGAEDRLEELSPPARGALGADPRGPRSPGQGLLHQQDHRRGRGRRLEARRGVAAHPRGADGAPGGRAFTGQSASSCCPRRRRSRWSSPAKRAARRGGGRSRDADGVTTGGRSPMANADARPCASTAPGRLAGCAAAAAGRGVPRGHWYENPLRVAGSRRRIPEDPRRSPRVRRRAPRRWTSWGTRPPSTRSSPTLLPRDH